MQIYYYCSYDGSPVGYQQGSLTYDPGRSRNYELTGQNIPPLIRACFDSGEVRKAFGRIPSDSRKFLLIKKLRTSGDSADEPSNYYVNFALATNDEKDYSRWIQNGESSPEAIAKAVKATMQLDGAKEHGFSVRPQALKTLIGKSFGCLLIDQPSPNGGTDFCVEMASEDTDLNRLANVLQLTDSNKQFSHCSKSKKWACYGVQKKTKVSKTVYRPTTERKIGQEETRKVWMLWICRVLGAIAAAGAVLLLVLGVWNLIKMFLSMIFSGN